MLLVISFEIIIFFSSSSSSFLSSSSCHYTPRLTLPSPNTALHCSRSCCQLPLQLLTPTFFRSSSTNWSHLTLGFLCTLSAFWFKNRKLSARIQFLHSKHVTQPPQCSYFYQPNNVCSCILQAFKCDLLSQEKRGKFVRRVLAPEEQDVAAWRFLRNQIQKLLRRYSGIL